MGRRYDADQDPLAMTVLGLFTLGLAASVMLLVWLLVTL
jgi:hypothetical protein